jgi:DNA replication protein DnaC
LLNCSRRTLPGISRLSNGWRCCSTARRRIAARSGFKSRLRNAKLRHGQASIEDVDYRAARRLDKALFQQLAAGRWIAEHRNLLITGPCGVGKSWLSCALAQRACRDGYTVHYEHRSPPPQYRSERISDRRFPRRTF